MASVPKEALVLCLADFPPAHHEVCIACVSVTRPHRLPIRSLGTDNIVFRNPLHGDISRQPSHRVARAPRDIVVALFGRRRTTKCVLHFRNANAYMATNSCHC